MRNAFTSNSGNEDSKLNTSLNQKKTSNERNPEKINNEYQNYIDFDELVKHLNFVNLKLERKKVKICEMKLQISTLYSQNHILNEKLRENEEFRINILEKLDLFENELKNRENHYIENESVLVNNYQKLEIEKIHLEEIFSKKEALLKQNYQELTSEKNKIEEKYNRLNNDYGDKLRELEELNKRIKEIEVFIEENNQNNGEFIKKLKIDVEDLKGKIYSYEKMIEIVVYFFKKISVNPQENENLQVATLDISILQQKLIELENTLAFHNKLIEKFHLTNEKNNDMLLQNENINNYLNDKVVDVKNENKVLKNQLKELLQLNKSLLYATSEISYKKTTNQTNNVAPLNNEKLNSVLTQLTMPFKKESTDWKDKYLVLEKRLYDIEKELLNTKTDHTQMSNEEGNVNNENNRKSNNAYNNRIKQSPSPLKNSINLVRDKEDFNVNKLTESFNNHKKSSNFVFSKKMNDMFGESNIPINNNLNQNN